jgi:Tripartite tricarboxylate transporter TctB family.
MLRIKNRNNVYAGLFMIGLAVVFLWQGRNLFVGTLDEMGPGYFPNLLCALLILLGLVVLVDGFVTAGPPPEVFQLRPLILVLASVGFFGLFIERLGLSISLFGVVMIAGLAQKRAQHLHNMILGIGLTLFCVLVFVKGLNLQMTVWPAGLTR